MGLASKYSRALAAMRAETAALIRRDITHITLPETQSEIPERKRNYMTMAGIGLFVLGIVDFIVGIILGIQGVWIAGLTFVACGVYSWVKGREELREEAFESLSLKILRDIEGMVAGIRHRWTSFIEDQNTHLRRDIIDSSLPNEVKARAVGKIADGAWIHVDVASFRKALRAVCEQEEIGSFYAFLRTAERKLIEAVNEAARAQVEIYSAVDESTLPSTPA